MTQAAMTGPASALFHRTSVNRITPLSPSEGKHGYHVLISISVIGYYANEETQPMHDQTTQDTK